MAFMFKLGFKQQRIATTGNNNNNQPTSTFCSVAWVTVKVSSGFEGSAVWFPMLCRHSREVNRTCDTSRSFLNSCITVALLPTSKASALGSKTEIAALLLHKPPRVQQGKLDQRTLIVEA
eukprot:1354611-Amphidinium_carterae.1